MRIGNGSTVESVRHCLYSLRRLLSPNYAVMSINGEVLLKEPWPATCALLVFPGGADLGYCRTLNGEGNRKIRQYVNRGGAYLGLCAGGYYASKRCEFMVGDKRMEVVGDRELSFFPGTCRGLAFPGFVYGSEEGAHAVRLDVNKDALAKADYPVPTTFHAYVNGGGVFVDAPKFADRGVELLASYVDKLLVDPGEGAAAVVYCKVGEGGAILASPHPEFAAINLDRSNRDSSYAKVVETLKADEELRISFFKACLIKLGLEVSATGESAPSLSPMYLSSCSSPDISKLLTLWKEVISAKGDEQLIVAEADTFRIEPLSSWSMGDMNEALPPVPASSSDETEAGTNLVDANVDSSKVLKRVLVYADTPPASKDTPYFNHGSFYAHLQRYNGVLADASFGRVLLYGEVVASTNTLLEKNPSFTKHVPHGFTMNATTQIAGRGRGSNVWISPPGALMFSTVLRHPMGLNQSAPVVFVQYLAALAIIHGIQGYAPAYAGLPVKLKWPNDIYALDPAGAGKNYVKIGGILVNSSYAGSDYTLIVGIGLNVANAAPSTSLNALAAAKKLEPFHGERLLASILSSFDSIYAEFCMDGWSRMLEEDYYSNWLHRYGLLVCDQIVTLEAEGGVRARIKGITRDWGLLLVEELGWEDRPTRKMWQLQSDSNSFDFFKGLLKRKV
ncbi:class II aaRS and biotin synthetase [Trichodelitschia bisporula]|uniref:Class II aaRS and biotin synthetase n=1 Tax=Trichodelitschia bisporula TaxID=703511 RepID=A0A6G1HJD6_9PEZI|nr:class II aaRS and biotin synthetase [Trichodelitschia bisporula]